MLKKDRKAIAKIIKRLASDPQECYDGGIYVISIAECIADYIATDNPYFNKREFIKSCGIT